MDQILDFVADVAFLGSIALLAWGAVLCVQELLDRPLAKKKQADTSLRDQRAPAAPLASD